MTATTGFTIEDQHLSKCSWINKKHEANRFLEMFSDTVKSLSKLNTKQWKPIVLESLTHVRVVVDHTLAIQLQRSAKLQISCRFYWSVSTVFSLSSLHVLSRKHLKRSFCYTFYSQLFNEMFVVRVNRVVRAL